MKWGEVHMLVEFKVTNFRSFKNETVLSMKANTRADDNEYFDFNTFETPVAISSNENRLIKSATIYGPNASGKSNVLKAIKYMRDAVMLSGAFDVMEHNEPFAFLSNNNANTKFEISFIEKEVYYEYYFSLKNNVIVEEKLYKKIERKTLVFERITDSIKISGVNAAIENIINVNKTVLFLTQAKSYSFGNASTDITNAFNWFSKLLIVFEEHRNLLTIYENKKYINQALDILKMADIGIEDFHVYKEKIEPVNSMSGKSFNIPYPTQILKENDSLNTIDIETYFNVYDENGNVSDRKPVFLLKDTGFHSEGTKRLLMYLGWILKALAEGDVILIDEIDSKLHFLLADYILRCFNSISKNLYNAQIICTAHNLLLMDGDIRRDEIYFTSKNVNGETILKSLAKFKGVLKKDLFSKNYLLGFYTELPNMREDF